MNKAQWVALSMVPGVGGITFRRLLCCFGSVSAILAASESDLRAVHGIGERAAGAIRHASIPVAESMLDALAKEGIRALTWEDAEFPPHLLACADAPPVLFVKGTAAGRRDAVSAAIVGRRAASPAALHAAESIAGELAARGIIVVSGLAMGVDTAAHRGVIKAQGHTLAVLGSGLHHVHPRQNDALARRIIQQGALLSELHPDVGPTPTQLVARDRIITGLSRWVIVVESNVTGGSMRAAEFARRQGRMLAALPGSPGTDALIAGGACALAYPNIDWDDIVSQIKHTDIAPVSHPHPQDWQERLLERPVAYLPDDATCGRPTPAT